MARKSTAATAATGKTAATSGKATEKQEQIWNLQEVAEAIGMATRGKPLSDTRIRALIDRDGKQEVDSDGKRVKPLDVEYRATGKWRFLFIKDADSDFDSVQAYIDAVKRGEYNTRTSGARIVLHNAGKLAATVTVPDGFTVPDGMTLQDVFEALATANNVTFKLAGSKSDDSDSDEDDSDGDAASDAENERRQAALAATPK